MNWSKSALAIAIGFAVSAGAAQAADRVVNSIITSQILTSGKTYSDTFDYKPNGQTVPGNIFELVISGSSTEITAENLSVGISTYAPANSMTQMQTLAISVESGAKTTFSGQTFSAKVETDAYGTNHSQTAALQNVASTVTIDADSAAISATSLAKNGKAVYAVSTGGLGAVTSFTGDSVVIRAVSNTDRNLTPNNANNRGEVMALDAYDNGTITSSENTEMHITVIGAGATPGGTAQGSNSTEYPTGAAYVYGIVAEGGSISLLGKNTLDVTAAAARAMGVRITNGSYTMTGSTHEGAGAVVLGTTSISVSTAGDAYGIQAEKFTPPQGSTMSQPIAFTILGDTTISAETTGPDSVGVGIAINESVKGEIKADTTISATDTALLVGSGATLSAANASVNIQKGDVESAGELNLVNSKVILASGSTLQTAELSGSNSSIIINSAKARTVAIADNQSEGLKVVASGTLADTFGSAEDAAAAMKEAVAAEGVTLASEAGSVADSWTMDENGNLLVQKNASLAAVQDFNAFNFFQWRNENNHLSQRLGDLRGNLQLAGAWARVYGTDSKYKKDVSADVKSNAVQVGGDVVIDGKWVVGAAFSYTDTRSDYDNGDAESDMYSLAAYASGFFDCGGYVDVVGRAGRLSSDVSLATGSLSGGVFSASYDNTAFGLSTEVGYRYPFADIFYVEPQVEVAYGYILGEDYSSSNGVTVSQDDFQSLTGRIGFRAGAEMAEGASIYATVSVNHEFLGDVDATVTPAAGVARKLSDSLGSTWVSYGLGAQFDTSKNLSFYGVLERSSGSDYAEDFKYSVGMRWNF